MKKILVFLCIAVFVYPLGAFAQTFCIVDQSGGGDSTTIQGCINTMTDGDTCLVMPGTYNENIDFFGKNITLRSDMDGDPGTTDISAETTIIDGNGTGYVVTSSKVNFPFFVLNGFTVRNGSTGIHGGYSSNSYCSIMNCIIKDNSGFGIYKEDVEWTITNCLLTNNGFSGIFSARGAVTVTDCVLTKNGGGIYVCKGGNNISNCIISGNFGIGICAYEFSNSVVKNCYITQNSGDGIYHFNIAYTTIENCTIYGNGGYEISASITSHAGITNSIVWGTATPGQPEIDLSSDSSITATYSDIQMENPGDVWPGTGNINVDPIFVSGFEGFYYLSQIAAGQFFDSPCVDSGSGSAASICFTGSSGTVCMDELTTRTDQVIDSGTVDMGYHHGSGLAVPLDIKPTSCPNPVNVESKGVLPVAILGTEDFDVNQIDPATVALEGVAPLRWAMEDVTTPYDPIIGKEACDECTEEGPDGHMDLTLKFKTQEIVAALGDVQPGDCLALTLTGNLKEEFGGTPIIGEDVVMIKMPGDANSDGCVNLVDLFILLKTWRKSEGMPGFDKRADFNSDGCINVWDFFLLWGNWGECL